MPDPSPNFEIKARRLKVELDDDKTFYWFYISLYLEERGANVEGGRGPVLGLKNIMLVEYHLLDPSFPEPDIRITKPANGFEYRFWLFGFIKVSADLVTQKGEIVHLPPTPISWPVTESELKLNGADELSW